MRRFSIPAALLMVLSLALILPLVGGEKTKSDADDKSAVSEKAPLVIHEWGTFTCLQDETGRAIPGVNTDDEPVPEFVHRITELIPKPSELAPIYYKGVPRTHRQVQVRLETPVLYFYPQKALHEPMRVNVKVGFRGGWLTEYYPNAAVSAPGLKDGNFRYNSLTPDTIGTLEWRNLEIGGNFSGPETDAAVWLAPREVRAAPVRTADKAEAEKYLFYRGVGNIRSPLYVTRNSSDDGLVIREQVDPSLGLRAPLAIRAMWLAHVRDDGSVAFRSLGGTKLTGEPGHVLATVKGEAVRVAEIGKETAPGGKAKTVTIPEGLFDEYAPEQLTALRQAMRKELIADGLYEDEADAMLKTWELAYFKSPGLRLFYLLPQQWTDAVLPLQSSVLADVSRTMVGRVELVTPKQREQLKKISKGPVSNVSWLYKSLENNEERSQKLSQLWEGKIRFSDAGIPVPPDYQAFIDLGRFRSALILDEHTRHPTAGLRPFVEAYNLSYYDANSK